MQNRFLVLASLMAFGLSGHALAIGENISENIGEDISGNISGNDIESSAIQHSSGMLIYQGAEYDSASLVLMHEPGPEIFLGVLHPDAALFSDYMDLNEIVSEHRHYKKQLTTTGARVITIRDILLEGTIDNDGRTVQGVKLDELQGLAASFLTFQSDGLSEAEAAAQQSYKSKVLNSATPTDLVDIIMLQPKIVLSPTQYNTGLKAQYLLNPIMNMFYMRDQMITTAKGIVIARMNSPQREKECDVAQFCLDKIDMRPLFRISGDGAYLEGGDFIACGNSAFIGCGMRTTSQAIDQLMGNDLLGCDTLIVVKDKRFSQAEMHLDTYFNVIDKDLVTMSQQRMTGDKLSKDFLMSDIYVKKAMGQYVKARADVPFVEFLTKDRGMDIITISPEDQSRLANNFLTVSARHIMAVDGQSAELCKKLADKKVTVTWLPLDNLRKGYGAAHCMTQVLVRKSPR